VLHVGDIAYVDDAFAHAIGELQYEKVYNGFMNWIQPIAANIPYMVSVGNHESECHGVWCDIDSKIGHQYSNFSAYNTRWQMPSVASNGALNMWYSYDVGNVHYVSIDCETDFPGAEEFSTGDSHDKRFPAGSFGRPGEYLQWLENDLRTAQQRSDIQWIVALGHRPMVDRIADAHVALFNRYGVDMYFCGHTHSYKRFLPQTVEDKEVTFDRAQRPHAYKYAKGFVQVVVGGAGCDEMPDTEDAGVFTGTTSADGIVYATSRFATGVLTVSDHSLEWKLFDSKTLDVLDQLELKK